MKRILIALLMSMLAGVTASAESFRYTYYDNLTGLSSNHVCGVLQDGRGLIWIATWNGLDLYDGYEFHWMKPQPGDGTNSANERIRQIWISEEGNIHCKTQENVFDFDLHTFSFRDLPYSEQAAILAEKHEPRRRSRDNQGNFWIVDPERLAKRSHVSYPAQVWPGTENLNVSLLWLDEEQHLWVGSKRESQIRIYDLDGTLLRTLSTPNSVYALCRTSKGVLWMGCKNTCLNPTDKGGIFRDGRKLYDAVVYDIKEDGHGRLWFACYNDGLKMCPDPDAPEPHIVDISATQQVRRLLITSDGSLLVATGDGILYGSVAEDLFDNRSLHWIQRDGNNAQSLASNILNDVVKDRRGNVYVATASSGVDRIEWSRVVEGQPLLFTHGTTSTSSLTTDFCNSITLVDDTTLMVVSNNSMMLYFPDRDSTVTYNNTFFSENCRFSEFKPLMLPDSSWLFSTECGLLRVPRAELSRLAHVPPIRWISVEVNGGAKEYARMVSDTLHLAASERNVILTYAAIDYVDNRGILYRNRMDNGAWSKASHDRRITLFNLLPGAYHLQIQSTDQYGRYVDNVSTLTILVDALWYETWEAHLGGCVLLLLLLALVLYVFYYIHRLRVQRKQLLSRYMDLLQQDTETSKHEESDGAGEHEVALASVMPATQNDTIPLRQEDVRFLDKVREYVDQNIGNPSANIDDMASMASTSRATLNRRLRALLGITAAQLLIDARMQYAANLLARKDVSLSINDIALASGYSDSHYFARSFKAKYGMTPSEYVRR